MKSGDDTSVSDRRASPRYNGYAVLYLVRLTLEECGTTLDGLIVDISRDGLRFKSISDEGIDEKVQPGCQVLVEIKNKHRIRANVAWRSNIEAGFAVADGPLNVDAIVAD